MAKAQHLLADLDPLSWALPHAAIAGFYLFLSGLITGFFANQAAYDDIGARLAQHPGLNRLLGARRAARVGQYVQAHLGGIMGNFLFGCMLGSTGVVGAILGLPLDIRHIAFSSANLGYALAGLEFQLGAAQIAWAVFGVLAIGAVNLAVSFALALRTALRARDAQIGDVWPILRALGHRLRRQPRQFVLPPRH
jgi:site-specific recombinase